MIYPINFPAQSPVTERLVLNRRQSATESPWTYRQQTVHTASQWALEWTWPPVSHLAAEKLDAWLLSLRGQVGSFNYAPRQRYASALKNIVLAQPGYAYNGAIVASGWNANATSGLRLGQWMQVGSQLLRIVEASAFATAAGQVTIGFEPELRVDLPNGTAVNFANPAGVFRMASSDGYSFTLTPDRLPVFGTLNAREVV